MWCRLVFPSLTVVAGAEVSQCVLLLLLLLLVELRRGEEEG